MATSMDAMAGMTANGAVPNADSQRAHVNALRAWIASTTEAMHCLLHGSRAGELGEEVLQVDSENASDAAATKQTDLVVALDAQVLDAYEELGSLAKEMYAYYKTLKYLLKRKPAHLRYGRGWLWGDGLSLTGT